MLKPILPLPIIVLLMLLFIALTLFLEWRNKFSTFRRVIRLAALTCLMIAMTGLVLNIQIKKRSFGKIIAYLSEGYSQQKLDSLKIRYNTIQIYGNLESNSPYKKVASLNHLVNTVPGIDSLFVLGYGLKKLEREVSIPFEFINSVPSGILGVNYPKELVVGDSAWITIHTFYHDTTLISLIRPNGKRDSIRINPGFGTEEFSINPTLVGEHLYKITTKRLKKRTVESIAIRVLPKAINRILILNEFPTFETKYLKSWLVKKGHKVTVRSKISKDKFRYEYVNTPPIPFKNFVANKYDVIIMDAVSFTSLRKTDLQTLKTVIRNGTGLFIMASEELEKNKTFASWFSTRNIASTKAMIYGAQLERLPVQFSKGRFSVSLAANPNGNNVMAQKRILGEGAIASSVVLQTYTLLLQGNKTAYNLYWTKIINALTSAPPLTTQWDVKAMPSVDRPMDIELITNVANPNVLVNDAYLPMIKRLNQIDEWDGRYWPTNAGWLNFRLAEDSINQLWEYIYPANSWEVFRYYQRYKYTQAQNKNLVVNNKLPTVYKPINSWIWYGLLMLSLLVLWIEPKL